MKGAFTRAFNKEGHLSHYSVTTVSKKAMKRSTIDSQSEYGDLESENVEQDSDNDEDLSSNPVIKIRKGSESSQSSGKGKRKAGGNGATAGKKRRTKS